MLLFKVVIPRIYESNWIVWKASIEWHIITQHIHTVCVQSVMLFSHHRSPQMHEMWTSWDCRAECISEGLGDHLARFSWQHTNYLGMDAEVHSHAGVTESSQPRRSTQVDFETHAVSSRSYWHLLIWIWLCGCLHSIKLFVGVVWISICFKKNLGKYAVLCSICFLLFHFFQT